MSNRINWFSLFLENFSNYLRPIYVPVMYVSVKHWQIKTSQHNNCMWLTQFPSLSWTVCTSVVPWIARTSHYHSQYLSTSALPTGKDSIRYLSVLVTITHQYVSCNLLMFVSNDANALFIFLNKFKDILTKWSFLNIV